MTTKLSLSPSGKELEILEGQTVLECLEQNGLTLPNNCRAGACGECKVKVKRGTFDQGLVLDMALSPQEREEGFGLMCMAKPTSQHLEIEWGEQNAGPKLFEQMDHVPYGVLEKNQRGKIIHLKLRSLSSRAIRFWPGQHVKLGCPEKGYPLKAFSLVGLPNHQGELEVLIYVKEKGKTTTWIAEELGEGDRLSVSGAYGKFIGNPSAQTPVICLAYKTGFAPILSLSRGAMLRGRFSYPVTILYFLDEEQNKEGDKVLPFGVGELKYLAQKFDNFRFELIYSSSQSWAKELQQRKRDLSPFSVFIAGPNEFVDKLRTSTESLHVNKNNLHLEKHGHFS